MAAKKATNVSGVTRGEEDYQILTFSICLFPIKTILFDCFFGGLRDYHTY
jgi:hypothetical protein